MAGVTGFKLGLCAWVLLYVLNRWGGLSLGQRSDRRLVWTLAAVFIGIAVFRYLVR